LLSGDFSSKIGKIEVVIWIPNFQFL
jgi:hypothetical protein